MEDNTLENPFHGLMIAYPIKFQIPNLKSQINYKSQITTSFAVAKQLEPCHSREGGNLYQ